MALAATRRPRGRLRSVMARTILGLDMVDTFTSSETCPEGGETQLTHKSAGATRAGQRDSPGPARLPRGSSTPGHPASTEQDLTATGLTMVKGMNWRMLPRLPCSRQSTHSSMNHWTNWVWVPAVLAPRMEEMSRKRFAAETGKYQKPGRFRGGWGLPKPPAQGRGPHQCLGTAGSNPMARPHRRVPALGPGRAIT